MIVKVSEFFSASLGGRRVISRMKELVVQFSQKARSNCEDDDTRIGDADSSIDGSKGCLLAFDEFVSV